MKRDWSVDQSHRFWNALLRPRWPRKSFEFKPGCDKWQTLSTTRIGRRLTALCTAGSIRLQWNRKANGFEAWVLFADFHEFDISWMGYTSAFLSQQSAKNLAQSDILMQHARRRARTRTNALYFISLCYILLWPTRAAARVVFLFSPYKYIKRKFVPWLRCAKWSHSFVSATAERGGTAIHPFTRTWFGGQKWSATSKLPGLIYEIFHIPTIVVAFLDDNPDYIVLLRLHSWWS